MRTVFASDVAKVALNAVLDIHVRFDVVVEIEMPPVSNAVHRFADDVVNRGETFLVEVVVQAVNHVLDDAVAIVHNGRADLNTPGTEEHELDSVPPCVDAADTADRNFELRITCKFGNHVESYRLHGRTAVTAVRRHAVDVRVRDHCVNIHAHHRVDRVYEGHCVCSAVLRSASRRSDVRDVWGELHDHREIGNLFHPFSDHARIFGHLAHRGAHSALAHAMRASEIQFKTVAARVLGLFDDLMPCFAFRFDHQRNDHRMVRISLFTFVDFLEIHLERTVGDQLDVVQPDHTKRTMIDRSKPRRHICDRLAKRLPNRTAPTGIERTLDHRSHIRRRSGCEPERIG